MKGFACNKVVGFQASVLLKVTFSTFNDSRIMATSAINFFKLIFSVSLLRKPQNALPKTSKFFIRPHYDHGYIIYDEAKNFAVHQKVDSFQYNASLAMTGPIRGTSKEKLY